MAKRNYKPGDVVTIRKTRYVVERQVLFNHPAYRVRLLAPRKGMERFSFVVDGVWIDVPGDPMAALLHRPVPREEVSTH